MMAEQTKLSVQMRYAAIKIESELNRSISALRQANKDNSELLLNELVKQYHNP